jgi:hypothetical protein
MAGSRRIKKRGRMKMRPHPEKDMESGKVDFSEKI